MLDEKSKLSIWCFRVLLFMVLIALVEVALRFMGYVPGDMKPKWLNFQPVDSLYIIPDFKTDADGILVANSAFFKEKMQLHINQDGFRSKDFAAIDSTKKKVLFIGDSFTWGMTAQPLDSSFTDILSRETNFEIINTGIPAADPPQYAAIAQKYIPLLKPDYVVVVFFTGNDIIKFERTVEPNESFYYFTNAGAILADIDGFHFSSAQQAYDYIVNHKYYLHHPKNFIEKIIAKSAVLSRLYSVRFRIEEKLEYERMVKNTAVTKTYLYKVIEVCENLNVPVQLVLIPEVKEADMSIAAFTEKYADLLVDSTLSQNWWIPENSKSNFNNYPDAHLNNKGHRYYAEYLKKKLTLYFENK